MPLPGTDTAVNLAAIGVKRGAVAVMAGQAMVAPAADDVSIAISKFFAAYGRAFEMASAHAAASLQDKIANVLNGMAAQDGCTDAATNGVQEGTRSPRWAERSGGSAKADPSQRLSHLDKGTDCSNRPRAEIAAAG